VDGDVSMQVLAVRGTEGQVCMVFIRFGEKRNFVAEMYSSTVYRLPSADSSGPWEYYIKVVVS